MYNLLKQFLLVCTIIIYGCSSTSHIENRYTADDKTVFDLLERLKKNGNDAEAARLLPDAYKQSAEVRKAMNSNTYNNMSAGDRWMEIANQLLVAEKMYTQIKSIPAASKVIPDPWSPTIKIQEAKQKAAEEYYTEGTQYMTYNNRAYAKKAYDMFVKANIAYPNFRDVNSRISIAKELSTIKVLIRPVNYNNFGWSYWGFQNDYLQYKMVRDLNNSSFSDVRFYTDADVSAQRIQTDKVVTLNFNDLFVGTIYNDNKTINRSKQIQVGETRSVPPQPIYENVKATVYITRRVLQSHASLECRIYDWNSGNNILFDRFPDTYTWTQESARYTGDKRALEQSDWNLINNPPNGNTPTRNEIVQRLIDNCYNSLLSRIRNGVKFE